MQDPQNRPPTRGPATPWHDADEAGHPGEKSNRARKLPLTGKDLSRNTGRGGDHRRDLKAVDIEGMRHRIDNT